MSGFLRFRGNDVHFRKQGYYVMNGVHYTNHEELIRNAEVIDGVPFIRLNELIKFKNALGRDKDKKDIELN